ncbi:MAG: hypothetical protein ACRC30_07790 [Clostridium sp.]
MINFKAKYKSEYNKILGNKKKKEGFSSKIDNEIGVNYGIHSERTRSINDRFVKVVITK